MTILPDEFANAMRQQLGSAFPAFADSLASTPPVSIRLHPLKPHTFDSLDPVPWSRWGRYMAARPSFTLDPLFHAGCYYVQEASSMFLEQALTHLVPSDQRVRILDLCAAPGGKSTHILSIINRDSLLVSNETIRTRANILAENIQKWGYPNAVVTNNDPADFRKLPGFFDVIVVDAPCSGEGLFRKDPRAAEEWSPHHVHLCADRQRRIIGDAWDSLREGGALFYSTCTYNSTENEENLRWIRDHYDVDFLKIPMNPDWGIEEVNENGIISYRFFPHRAKGEGFFLAAMRKTERSDGPKLKSKKSLSTPSPKVQDRLMKWIEGGSDATFFQFGDLVFYTPASMASEFAVLLSSLRIVYAGTNLATIKHEKLIPEHALALAVNMNRSAMQHIEVDENTAIRYLRRDALEHSGYRPGFTLVLHRGVPLGWINVLANRVNNMYPSTWRIRLENT